MTKSWSKDSLYIVLITTLLIALASVYKADRVYNYRTLDEIKDKGKLVALTLNAPNTYFINRDGKPAGPDYHLVKSFAKYLGVELEFRLVNNLVELFEALEDGQGDLAAASLNITEERKRRYLFGPAYGEIRQQVICRRGGARPRSVEGLYGVDLLVQRGSSHDERLRVLKEQHPKLEWRVTTEFDAEQIFEQIWRRELGCSVMDSTLVAINQRYFPEIRVRFDLDEPRPIAWIMPLGSKELKAKAYDWFAEYQASGKLDRVKERYYSHVNLFDYVDTASLIRRIPSRYIRFRPYFQEAAEAYGFSESLLAAQAYQESHWNPKARSPTGVRGIMMLTLPTAKQMGIKNRINPKNSIMGGARYLAKLKAELAKDILEPDLTWFALAAYNVGMGHLRDAQTLAEGMGKDPHSWYEMKDVLPLLSKREYYKTTRFGYARGSEPVTYVQRVREYQHILTERLAQMDEILEREQAIQETAQAISTEEPN